MDKKWISRVIAKEIYLRQTKEGGDFRIPGKEVLPLAEAQHIVLEELELKSHSLLNRDAEGRYKFSHKSILEYFLAKEVGEDAHFRQSFSFEGMGVAQQFYERMRLFPVMIRIESGTFEMGSNEHESEKPIHPVSLSTFEMSKYPVTQQQWQAIMGNNPSRFTQDENCPVENVSWGDTQKFLQKLNELTQRTYRLPTEAEWEFAARGGLKPKGYEYAGSNNLAEVGWYNKNAGNKTHPIGQKNPNELGLYDMSGNVWEWCQDWYGEYPNEPQTNPNGAKSGGRRVLRGGSWLLGAAYCRVAVRDHNVPTYRLHDAGFRLARTP